MSSEMETEQFAYYTSGFSGCESPLAYRPGGFHPVVLGAVIASPKTRYHVAHKLGAGSSATAWLVQDLSSYTWHALRIRRSSLCGPKSEAEDAVLSRLTAPQSHFPIISDIFTIEGPNGTHAVLVTDVIAPLSQALQPDVARLNPSERKAIVRGLVEAVAQLHTAGVVHGDLHVHNVGFALPSKLKFIAELPLRCPIYATPELIPLVGETPDILTLAAGMPPYLVRPINTYKCYDEHKDKEQPHFVKIFDFGHSHLAEKPDSAANCGLSEIAPPEWALQVGTTWFRANAASDIWALGLLMFNVMSGGKHRLVPFFLGEGETRARIITLAGGTVPAMVNTDSWFPEPPVEDLWQRNRANLLETYQSSEEDIDALVRLLRKVLTLDPSKRPSAEDILRDPWFSIPVVARAPVPMLTHMQSPARPPFLHSHPYPQPYPAPYPHPAPNPYQALYLHPPPHLYAYNGLHNGPQYLVPYPGQFPAHPQNFQAHPQNFQAYPHSFPPPPPPPPQRLVYAFLPPAPSHSYAPNNIPYPHNTGWSHAA